MLYNPKWTETKADPFSLESLIAWLETMPAAVKYDWSVAERCLLGQWCASQGLRGHAMRDKSLELGCYTCGTGAAARVALDDLQNCTFGAALERARAIQRSL